LEFFFNVVVFYPVTKGAVLNVPIINFILLVYVPKAFHKFCDGTYIPYIPKDEEINQFQTFLDTVHQHVPNWIDSSRQVLQLNYHLLKFIQENCLPKVSLKENNQEAFPEIIVVDEGKRQVPTYDACTSPRWSSRLLPFSDFELQLPRLQPNPQFATIHSCIVLTCKSCQINTPMLAIGFTEQDHLYTMSRFNIRYEEETLDSAIRGSILIAQPSFTLTELLTFAKGIRL